MVKSTMTNREYNIRRHYNCQSTWVIYVVTCTACQIQYIGQTKQTMVARQLATDQRGSKDKIT